MDSGDHVCLNYLETVPSTGGRACIGVHFIQSFSDSPAVMGMVDYRKSTLARGSRWDYKPLPF